MSEDSKPSEKSDRQDSVENNATPDSPKGKKKTARRSSARKPPKDGETSIPETADNKDETKDAPNASKTGNADHGGADRSSGRAADESGGRRRRSRGGRDGGANKSREGGANKSSSKHDPALLVKHAWKIYLGEINEEGVTLMDDKAARQLATRSFELAAIFLDEQGRHSQG